MPDTLASPEERLLKLLQRMRAIPVLRPPDEFPLSMPQVAVLRWVARSPGCGVRDIAKGLHVTPPTISVGVRRLVEDGWLEQRSDPHDRRARPLYPTEKGQQYLGTLRQHHNRMLKVFLSGLSPEEQEILIDLLGRAITALEEAQTQN
jgi:DNA-binding MarR family transcriptional regulator